MKKILSLLFILLVTSCNDINYKASDRNSLSVIFGIDSELINKELSADDFRIYSSSLKFLLLHASDRLPSTWSNTGESGISGTVTFTKTTNEDFKCRAFKQSITIKDQTFNGKGKACLINGSWIIK